MLIIQYTDTPWYESITWPCYLQGEQLGTTFDITHATGNIYYKSELCTAICSWLWAGTAQTIGQTVTVFFIIKYIYIVQDRTMLQMRCINSYIL